MKLRNYIEDHILFILFSLLWVICQTIMLLFFGVKLEFVWMLSFMWFLFLSVYFLLSFMKKKKQLNAIFNASEKLDKKYLLHEVMPKNGSYEDECYRMVLRDSCKSMLENVSTIQRERKVYQEYVEQWVHEIKTPIAAMNLWCENQSMDRKKEAMLQLEKMQHYVDQALFYARSENVEKDFRVRQVSLHSCIKQSLLECKYLCTSSQVNITLPEIDAYVYSDEKWITFILNQLIENAIKYKSDKKLKLGIRIQQQEHGVLLSIDDNGRGIQSQDLPRIFEKGFTGENGRTSEIHATGIGLYLCKRLCVHMNIDLSIESIYTKATTINLFFHAV